MKVKKGVDEKMSDFVSNELIEIDVFERKFKVKEMSGKEMDLLKDKALKIGSDGFISYSLSIQNDCYLACVVEAPYDEFKNTPNKVDFLNNLKSSIRDELIKQIKSIHETELIKK